MAQHLALKAVDPTLKMVKVLRYSTKFLLPRTRSLDTPTDEPKIMVDGLKARSRCGPKVHFQ